MARKFITEAEGKIMDVLWAQSPLSMMEITHRLEEETDWTKYTVTTLLRRMLEKGTIAVDTSGPIRMYSPAIPKEAVARQETESLLRRMFSGKASLLVSNLVEEGELSREELRELLDMLEAKEQ